MFINGPKAHYFIDESHFVPDQTPIVFLHGFMGSHESWNDMVAHLKTSSLTIDLPGHGQSTFTEKHPTYSWLDWSNDFKSILDSCHISKVNLYGYSMGGRLALMFANAYPHYIKSLILESSTPGIIDDKERNNRKIQDTQNAQLIRANYSQFLTQWEQHNLFLHQKIRNEDGWNNQKEIRCKQDPSQIATSLEILGTGSMPPLWDNLPNYHFSVTVITGDDDAKFSKIGQKMNTLLPNCHLKTIPNCGHNVHLEKGNYINNFLQNLFLLESSVGLLGH